MKVTNLSILSAKVNADVELNATEAAALGLQPTPEGLAQLTGEVIQEGTKRLQPTLDLKAAHTNGVTIEQLVARRDAEIASYQRAADDRAMAEEQYLEEQHEDLKRQV